MNKTIMTLGVLAAAGTLSICPLCGAGATSTAAAARGPIVSYENSRAVVTFDPSKVSIERMVAAIKKLGYTATLVSG